MEKMNQHVLAFNKHLELHKHIISKAEEIIKNHDKKSQQAKRKKATRKHMHTEAKLDCNSPKVKHSKRQQNILKRQQLHARSKEGKSSDGNECGDLECPVADDKSDEYSSSSSSQNSSPASDEDNSIEIARLETELAIAKKKAGIRRTQRILQRAVKSGAKTIRQKNKTKRVAHESSGHSSDDSPGINVSKLPKKQRKRLLNDLLDDLLNGGKKNKKSKRKHTTQSDEEGLSGL